MTSVEQKCWEAGWPQPAYQCILTAESPGESYLCCVDEAIFIFLVEQKRETMNNLWSALASV